MNLEKQAQVIDTIRTTMAGLVGERLKVRANMGRSKIIESDGALMQVHPQLFIMEVDRKRGRKARQSYQYVDILTGTVEIFKDGELVFERFDFDSDEPVAELGEALGIDEAVDGLPLDETFDELDPQEV